MGYTFNLKKGIAAAVIMAILVEAMDDDEQSSEEEFGQGDLLGGYFSGDIQ